MSQVDKKDRRNCPCREALFCAAYQRLYPIDPKCVRGLKKELEEIEEARKEIKELREMIG